MKVILLKDVKNLGKVNAVIEVNDGYATNYLLPKKLAKTATPTHLVTRDAELKIAAEEMAKHTKIASELKQILEQVLLRFSLKIGANGRAHHSISKRQIEEELSKNGIDMQWIEIPPVHINIIGLTSVKIMIKVLSAKPITALAKVEVFAGGE